MVNVCVLGAFDVKQRFLLYLANSFKLNGCDVTCVDFGGRIMTGERLSVDFPKFYSVISDIEKQQIANEQADQTSNAVRLMKEKIGPFFEKLTSDAPFDAIIGAGGSNGTDICIAAMQAVDDKRCQKICISTVAAEVHVKGIDLIPSFTDITGLNPILASVADYVVKLIKKSDTNPPHRNLFPEKISRLDWIHNAMKFIHENIDVGKTMRSANKLVAITMFGVTTPCVEKCAEILEASGYQPVVFHAVGTSGGELMASLIHSGMIQGGVIDLTTTEIADTMFGGELSSSYARFYTAASMGVPQIISCGALDVINYLKGKLPKDREQNPKLDWNIFCLSRTTHEDNAKMGVFLADVANQAPNLTRVAIPKYFSKLATPENIFYFPEADEAFTNALETSLSPLVSLIKYDGHINDLKFSAMLVQEFLDLKASLSSACLTNNSISSSFDRKYQILKYLREIVQSGKPIIGAGAGSGLAAIAEEQGGADLLIVYNSGYFRSHGAGSLAGLMPYGNANKISLKLSRLVLNATSKKHVIAGLCASDPQISMRELLQKVVDLGAIGIQNFPTVGLIDEDCIFRQGLEETGMGYDKEVKMMQLANQHGLLTTPYVFSELDAEKMAKIGADIIVIHLGLTISSIGGKACKFSLEDAPTFVQNIINTIRRFNDMALILIHGGPLNSMESVIYVIERTKGLSGFYGASNFERVPPFYAIKKEISNMKSMQIELK